MCKIKQPIYKFSCVPLYIMTSYLFLIFPTWWRYESIFAASISQCYIIIFFLLLSGNDFSFILNFLIFHEILEFYLNFFLLQFKILIEGYSFEISKKKLFFFFIREEQNRHTNICLHKNSRAYENFKASKWN